MPNPLYWEDQVSSTHGGQVDMIVSTHAPSFAVSWGTGRYDDVRPVYFAEARGMAAVRPCRICAKPSAPDVDLCPSCQRTANADERRRMAADQAMGSGKRSSELVTGPRQDPRCTGH